MILLLLIPKVKYMTQASPGLNFTMTLDHAYLKWQPCPNGAERMLHVDNGLLLDKLDLAVCLLQCPYSDASNACEVLSNGLEFCSKDSEMLSLGNVSFQNVEPAEAHVLFDLEHSNQTLELTLGCNLNCRVPDSMSLVQCSHVEGNPVLTNVLYFILRGLANICLGCNFLLIDAQTIQMCKREEALGRSGEIGRQYVYSAIAQAAISPVVGKLMDYVSSFSPTNEPNYIVPFAGNVLFLTLTLLMVCKIQLDIDLPKSTSIRGLGKVFSNVDILVFLALTLVTGACWGFVETFLFMYLKDDMGAPMYILGLTITVGALVSIPFLIGADWIVKKVGRANMFIATLFIYAIRYLGYSYITNPWMSFPFEGLEVFTNTLFRVASIRYIGEIAPKGLLATLNGLVGGLHYGMGKGMGSLLGGAIIASSGSTAFAFRLFGIASAIFGVMYVVYEYCIRRCCKLTSLEGPSDVDEEQTEKVFLPETQGFLAEQNFKLGSVTSIDKSGLKAMISSDETRV
eukprot:TCALIF_06275-PA protein Name:"Similar to mfsd6b Major facilitator superfamily domain-containing protein 6-B (Danio rerio)" AED:0.12 eAED:0.12 QI:0/0.6/0.5/0.66/0.8/0.66/6/102/512